MQIEDNAVRWDRVPINSIEDLSNAVYGAGLDAFQLTRAPVTGSLAFATCDNVMYSTGYIGSRVSITGSLSESMVTLGLGIVLTPGSRQWLNEVATGNFGVFLPGDNHDALYGPGSLYVTATTSMEYLEEASARIGLVLDAKTLGGSGVSSKKFSGPELADLRAHFMRVHAADISAIRQVRAMGSRVLRGFIEQIGRPPQPVIGGADPRGHARIVARAREFIHCNLDKPLSIDAIAHAASTSHRTLHRSFQIVLGETPYSYVQKLRLHRIRNELISGAEMACTITVVASRWGITELGRFAGWYRELFGELPSETLSRRGESQGQPTRA